MADSVLHSIVSYKVSNIHAYVLANSQVGSMHSVRPGVEQVDLLEAQLGVTATRVLSG